MYLARFSSPQGDFLTALYRWSGAAKGLLPATWRNNLLRAPAGIDVSVRLQTGGSAASSMRLLLTTAVETETPLRNLCDRLLRSSPPSPLEFPNNSGDFDRLAGEIPPCQLRVHYEGYQHEGVPLACDFRLYPLIAGCRDAGPISYQFHLRTYQSDPETNRQIRKYLAQLEINRPFSDPVRNMQSLLVRRLLRGGSLAAEHLAFPDAPALERTLANVQTYFAETTGRIGFPEPPIETGDFSDWLFSGRHPTRDRTQPPSIPCEGATLFGEQEVSQLMASRFAAPPDGQKPPSATGQSIPPDVFISYSSSDFACASSACDFLEDNGLVCWIAPRDINRTLSSYPEAISHAMSKARAVVVLLSDTANLSVHIPRELDMALERKLPIVPIRLQDVTPSGQLDYLLRTCQWLDAYNREFREAMNELRGRLHNYL